MVGEPIYEPEQLYVSYFHRLVKGAIGPKFPAAVVSSIAYG